MTTKMAAVLKHWREASTLILVTARHKGANVKPNVVSSSAASAEALKGANFDVLLLKRSAKSKFMPNRYVFPGGVASDVDFSADWIQVFDLLGKDHRQDIFDFVQRGGQGAPMFSRLRDAKFSQIPSEIAFRICAIRETFEESGVLIAHNVDKADHFQPPLLGRAELGILLRRWNCDQWVETESGQGSQRVSSHVSGVTNSAKMCGHCMSGPTGSHLWDFSPIAAMTQHFLSAV